MRFKAKLAPNQVQLLTSVVTPISKLCGSGGGGSSGGGSGGGGIVDPATATTTNFLSSNSIAVVYLDHEYTRISYRDKNDIQNGGITCFAELNSSIVFTEYRIESAANNVIVFQIDLLAWKMALQSILQTTTGMSSSSSGGGGGGGGGGGTTTTTYHQSSLLQYLNQPIVTMKLAKRNDIPCLCLEGAASSTFQALLDIYQMIPIRIMRSNDMKYHLPPEITTKPTVQLELPSSASSAMMLRPMVEKLKQLGPFLYLQASMKGDLTIRFDQEGKASVACFYHQLIPRFDTTALDNNNNNNDHDTVAQETLRANNNNNNNNTNNAMEVDDDIQDADESQKSGNSRGAGSSSVATASGSTTAKDPTTATTTLKIDATKLSKCLQWQQQYKSSSALRLSSSCLLGMIPNEMLVLHVVLNPEIAGFFTYYIPVYYLDPEEEDELR